MLILFFGSGMMHKIKAAVIGATGYAGVELLRLLANHPVFDLTYASSESYAQKMIAEIFPHLNGLIKLHAKSLDLDEIIAVADVVFIALPSGHAIQCVPTLLAAGKKVVDLGGDFRLKNPLDYEYWYKQEAPDPTILHQAVYGLVETLPEKNTDARLIANPGCYATAALLAATPALTYGLIDTNNIIFDGKSGISGAGRELALAFHFCEASENMYPYQIGGLHRHTPEMEQELSRIAKHPITVQFTPHVVPLVRGLIVTAYFNLVSLIDIEEVYQLYQKFYENCFFILIGGTNQTQAIKQVRGTNNCQLTIYVDKRTHRLIVISVLDNLIKGAAGQAIQNMNLICGLDETTGLERLSVIYP